MTLLPMTKYGIRDIGILATVFAMGCTTININEGNETNGGGAGGTGGGGGTGVFEAGETGGSTTTAISTVSASLGDVGVVPAPQYDAKVSVTTLLTNSVGQVTYVDPDGKVSLSLQGQRGQQWAIVHGHDLSAATFSQADAWFNDQKATGNPLLWGSWDTSQQGVIDGCGEGEGSDAGDAGHAMDAGDAGDAGHPKDAGDAGDAGEVGDTGKGGDAKDSSSCPTFPITDFVTVADDLSPPLKDAILIQNKGAGGVVSYEVITLTFTVRL
jgi:hypothetical protein